MNECITQRKLLADEFKAYRKVFIALGDETRQQIFIVLLEHDTLGMARTRANAKDPSIKAGRLTSLQILKEAGLINMHRVHTMNYYYVDADESCWHGLKALIDHVDKVVCDANKNGYPKFREDESQ